MTDYRAYQLDPAGHIADAQWLQADSDEAAESLALRLCGPGVPTVELWQAARRVAVLSCGEGGDAGADGGPGPASSGPAGLSAKQAFRQPAGRAADWLRQRVLAPRGRRGRSLAPGAAPFFRG